MYKKLIKPVLFLFSPDFVHNQIIFWGKLVQATPIIRVIFKKSWLFESKNLEQQVLGLNFKNPVGLSAGFDKNIELMPLMESVGFGFTTGGSVTLKPRVGNPRPWFYRLPKTGSLAVYAGMANKGLAVIYNNIKANNSYKIPLMISVAVVDNSNAGTVQGAIKDTIAAIKYILANNLASSLEINISCPNVGSTQPFIDIENLKRLLIEADKVNRKVPFFIKMPNLADISEFDNLLKVIASHNIQGITIANLIKDRQRVDIKDDMARGVKGGLSGLPTKDSSTALIKHTYKNYSHKLVIIGVGGVFTAQDAYDKIKAGASLVALITGMIFEGPAVIGKINQGLATMLERDGFSSIKDAIGADVK